MDQTPSFLVELYDSVHPFIRWVMAILTAGTLTLAWQRWKRQEEQVQVMAERERFYITREEFLTHMGEIKREQNVGFGRIHERLDTLFFKIGTNHPDPEAAPKQRHGTNHK